MDCFSLTAGKETAAEARPLLGSEMGVGPGHATFAGQWARNCLSMVMPCSVTGFKSPMSNCIGRKSESQMNAAGHPGETGAAGFGKPRKIEEGLGTAEPSVCGLAEERVNMCARGRGGLMVRRQKWLDKT
jgi:hypothetical protein